MNRFFDVSGDVSLQLAPWQLEAQGKPVKTALFVLQLPLRFLSDIAGGVIVVPKGYTSDLASIPQFAWSIFMAQMIRELNSAAGSMTFFINIAES